MAETGMSVITPVCPICQTDGAIYVITSEYLEWRVTGELIQNAMSNPPDQLEQLLTGIHPKCWDDVINSTEEDEPVDLDEVPPDE